ncbi:FadR family transcriptional regulator [Prauserella sp. PE36]|uniref:FadR/GntR family transcriptional regulator n=1 Tax=Prauserella sp. PE36 TaxID=1504709 RepID=UPI000DE46A41|nr:FadR/GntR family transcriptional regulator [Prauserella sp. PE36]RBM17699.1 FadR family transcriptional regulator [Prauserella sp. PE36]
MSSESEVGARPITGQSGMFNRVTSGRVSNLIVERIRVLIRDGQLKAGDRLPSERELGDQFGVSRVTVREALKMLEANGLVTIKVGARGGAFVTAPTSERVGEGISDLLTFSVVEPADVTEARQVFEIGIVPLVCRRADAQDVHELLEICDRADALQRTEGEYPVSLSAEFHVRVARATHNPALELLARTFHGPVLRSLMRAQEEDPSVGIKGAQEHREFVEAVQMRDVAAATAVMTAHLARTAERLRPGE